MKKKNKKKRRINLQISTEIRLLLLLLLFLPMLNSRRSSKSRAENKTFTWQRFSICKRKCPSYTNKLNSPQRCPVNFIFATLRANLLGISSNSNRLLVWVLKEKFGWLIELTILISNMPSREFQ